MDNFGNYHFTCLDHSLTCCGAKLVEAELIWNIPCQEIKNTACNWKSTAVCTFIVDKNTLIICTTTTSLCITINLSSNRRKILHFWPKVYRHKQSKKKVILTRNTLIDILANKVSSGAFFIFYRQFMKRGFFMNMRLSWNGLWRSWAFILFPWSYIFCIEYQRWFTLKAKQNSYLFAK